MLAFWGLLLFSHRLYLDKLWVYGDSHVIIEHLNKDTSLNMGHLDTWMERIKVLRRTFSTITFSHIYREKNTQADQLSKQGLNGRFGEIHYELIDASSSGAKGMVIFF